MKKNETTGQHSNTPAQRCSTAALERFMPIAPVDDVCLPPKEAAKKLGIEKKTLANWRSEGSYGPPFVRLPSKGGRGRIRYPLSWLIAWRDENVYRSTSDPGKNGSPPPVAP